MPAVVLLLLVLVSMAGSVAIWMVVIKLSQQIARDRQHRTYRIESFPPETDTQQLADWIHATTGTLRPGLLSFMQLGPVPTVVFEVVGNQDGITHRLKVPWRHEYVIDQLYSHVPGIRIVAEDSKETPQWKHAVEMGAMHSARTYAVQPDRMWNTIRGTLLRCRGDEQVIMQWVVSPATPTELPEQDKALTTHPTLKQLLTGDLRASRGEVDERRKKAAEPNLVAVLRIAAYAETDERSEHLLDDIRKAMASARGTKARFAKRPLTREAEVVKRIKHGRTPFSFPIKLSLTELVSLIGWPIGSSLVPGIATSMSRHLPPTTLVPTAGRGLGTSTMYGRKRQVAVSYTSSLRHTYLLGRTGVGKTTLMENMAVDDMNNGYGVFVIEADGNLFERVLQRVPDKRMGDVYVVDLGDTTHPVGFNIFDQNNSRTAIDELSILIDRMYHDGAKSITSPRMLYNFAHALAEVPKTTFIDLATLITPAPKTSVQGLWRDYIARQVKDPDVASYLQSFLNQTPAEQDRMVAPLYNRTWEFMRPEVRLILGQRSSSFNMRDVVAQNKILLVNLGNSASPIAASLIGTFFVNAIRQAVNAVQAPKPNFLYLDEFEQFMGFYTDMDAILDRARKRNLGLVLAHQRLSQLPSGMVDGVMTNTATKVVFRTSAKNAGIVAQEFGGFVDRSDFTGLPDHEAIALVGTDSGSAPPVSIRTRPPGKPTGNAPKIRNLSRTRHGRPIADVERDLANYSIPEQAPQRSRPRVSGGE